MCRCVCVTIDTIATTIVLRLVIISVLVVANAISYCSYFIVATVFDVAMDLLTCYCQPP